MYKRQTRLINESVSIQTFREKLRAIRRIISESVQYGESLRMSWTRAFTESIQVVETQVHLSAMLRRIAESVSVSETRLRVRGMLRIINNSLSVSESIIRLRGIFRIINNTLSVSESIIRLRGLGRMVNESISVQTFREKIRVLKLSLIHI